MNVPHSQSAAHAEHVTRRQFFGRSAVGHRRQRRWRRCLNGDPASRRDAGSEAALPQRFGGLAGLPHFRAEGEAGHLSVSERRAVARRPVRLQADAPQDARQADSRRGRRRQAVQHDDRRPDGPAVPAARSPSSRSTARAARGSATSCRTPPTIADDLCFVKSLHTDGGEPRPGDHVLPHRRRAGRPAEHGRVAHLRPRQRHAKICRRSS